LTSEEFGMEKSAVKIPEDRYLEDFSKQRTSGRFYCSSDAVLRGFPRPMQYCPFYSSNSSKKGAKMSGCPPNALIPPLFFRSIFFSPDIIDFSMERRKDA